MSKCDGQVHKLPFPSRREVICEAPLETSAACNGQVKWSPEPMGKLHLFKYSFSHLFFNRLAGRKISHLLTQEDTFVGSLKFWDSASHHWVKGGRLFGIRGGHIFKGRMPNEELDTRTLRMVSKRCPETSGCNHPVKQCNIPEEKEASTATLRKPKISRNVAVLAYLTDTYSFKCKDNLRTSFGMVYSKDRKGHDKRTFLKVRNFTADIPVT